jgi:hypothetical protein
MFLPRGAIGALPLFKVGLTRTRRTESGLRVCQPDARIQTTFSARPIRCVDSCLVLSLWR